MALTRDFKDTIRAHGARSQVPQGTAARGHRNDRQRRHHCRQDGSARLHQCDRGFAGLAEATNIPSRSLRMLGPRGNPRAANLFEVVSFLRRREGVRFHVRTAPA
jgi:hypothetical protein